jgi:acyl-CoA thioester hydrolase
MPEAHVFFRQEMFLADELIVYVRVSELKRSSFSLEYRIERQGELTAEGQTPLVCFDYEKRKPCRMPADFRNALTQFEQL